MRSNQKRPGPLRIHAVQEEIFHTRSTTASVTAIVAVGILACSWAVGLFRPHITPVERFTLLVGGTLVAFFAWRDALVRIRLRDSVLIAEYVLRRRVIPYEEIEDMGIDEEVPARAPGQREPLKEVIVLRRRHGPAIVLRNFDDDIAAPFGALQRRWSTWMDQARPDWRSSLPPKR